MVKESLGQKRGFRRRMEFCNSLYNLIQKAASKQALLTASIYTQEIDRTAPILEKYLFTNGYTKVAAHRDLSSPRSTPCQAHTLIPAGALRRGVLSAFCSLTGESDVKGEGILDDAGVELTGNFTRKQLSTSSGLTGYNPAGIALAIPLFFKSRKF